MRELSLFSGYGGFSLGLKLAGINTRTIAYVEWEKYAQEIIKARIKDKQEGKFGLDDAPIFSDISSFRGEQFTGLVDILTAGPPCPPFSVAGKRQGTYDPRNTWPDTLRVIRAVAPRYVLLENVAGILSSRVDERTPAYGGVVVGQLTEIGYDCFWEVVGADDASAPHRRKRWFCFGVLADSDSQRGCSRATDWQYAGDAGQPSETEECHRRIPTWPPGPSQSDEWGRILAERPYLAPALTKDALAHFRGMVDGRTYRVEQLKALGNGVVPAAVALFLRRLLGGHT